MNPTGTALAKLAILRIEWKDYSGAVRALRAALKQTTNRRAWSKLMLAIRELNRVVN